MSEIGKSDGICTQITTVKLTPDNQEEVLNLMKERARFMASQPGFISVNLHRSKDGSHVVNYIQWQNAERLAAAHHHRNSGVNGRASASLSRRSSPTSTKWFTLRRRKLRRKTGSVEGHYATAMNIAANVYSVDQDRAVAHTRLSLTGESGRPQKLWRNLPAAEFARRLGHNHPCAGRWKARANVNNPPESPQRAWIYLWGLRSGGLRG